MNQLPPPTSPPSPAPGDEPIEPRTGSRRRLVLAAVAATALGVSGVAIGSQLVAADDDVPADEPTTTEEERPDEIDEPNDEERDDEIDEPNDDSIDAEPEEDVEAPDDAEPGDDLFEGRLSDFDKLFDFEELKTAFEEFDACLSERLPDFEDSGWIEGGEFPDLGEFDLGDFDGDWDAAFDDLVGGSVTVFSPGGENDFTFLDFGDGDGTITITQTDGEIEIRTDGDVETVDADMPFDLKEFDMSDLDLSELPDIDIELDPEFDAALEECSTLLPDGGIFDMVGDVIDEFDHDGD